MAIVVPNDLTTHNLWLGVPDLSKDQIKKFDAAYTGNVHIFVVKTPPIFEAFYPTTHANTLKIALEKTSTSLSGLPELNLNYQDQVHGFADRKIPHATYSELNFDQITIRSLEFKGIPILSMMNEWIENISDPISKAKDYKGHAKDIPGGYSLENHTCSFVACTADPTNTMIQGRAHYITVGSPVNVTNQHYEWNSGEVAIIEAVDITLRGVLRWGDEIDAYAASRLESRMKLVNYRSGGASTKL